MRRTLDIRFEVIRNGVKYTDLQASGAPRITMDYASEIKSSLSGAFLLNKDVDWLQDEISPVAIINGVEHRLGVYAPATIERIRRDGHAEISVEAYDRCWKAKVTKTEGILHLSAGTNYLSAVESLLLECGIALMIKTPNSSVLSTDREDWEIGTDYLTIINTLLDEINYNELWFDENGYAVLKPDGILNIDTAVRTYDYNSIQSMMIDQSSVTLDLFDTPNVIMCVCPNIDTGTTMLSTAVNTNPSSPFSVPRRNKRIMDVQKLNNIPSQNELNEYAQILINEVMFRNQPVTIETALMPYCGVNDVVAIVHPDSQGLALESSWTMDLQTGGTMTHTLLKQPNAITDEEEEIDPREYSCVVGIAVVGYAVIGRYIEGA